MRDLFPVRPTVLLMRHAKSSWKDRLLRDHDRPLNKRGRRDAPRMAEFLSDRQLIPDRVICSSARRAVETAQGLTQFWHISDVQVDPRLYGAGLETWCQVFSEVPGGACTLLVGHNPSIEEVLQAMTGQRMKVPTAAVACLSLQEGADAPALESLEMVAFFRPKAL